jgi:hypothetical protein
MWNKKDSILSILQTRDVLILDRGFRDVIDLIEASEVDTFMPHCLKKGQDQFTVKEANESRKITKLRYVCNMYMTYMTYLSVLEIGGLSNPGMEGSRKYFHSSTT